MIDQESENAIEHETVQVGNIKYFTGEAARLYGSGESTVGLRNDWVNSPQYAALVLSTMKRFEKMGAPGLSDAYVIVGTPADLYINDKQILESLTQAILKTNEIEVLSQPLGVYFSYVLDQMGKSVLGLCRDEKGKKKSWTIVEVGEFDTGFMLEKEGAHQHDRNDIAEGISRAATLLKMNSRQKKIRLDLLQCSEALRTQQIYQ